MDEFSKMVQDSISLTLEFTHISKREYFLRLFPADWIGKAIIRKLSDADIIDPKTLVWDLGVKNKGDLATFLMYYRRVNVFVIKPTPFQLVEIAMKVFSVELSEATLRNYKKAKSFIILDLNL